MRSFRITRALKESNLAGALADPRFQFHELDLRYEPLDEVLDGVEVVFHLAAMAGLAKSWTHFELYWTCNVLATQRLLEAVRARGDAVRRLIYASTSSVYGKFASGDETLPTKPISPYGVTKLAGENLCRAYAEGHGLPVVVLRYFSVYGPRQRPDMGYHQFIRALLRHEPVVVCGDGLQVRGNTYVDDCVTATIAAAEARPGEVFNLGGDETASVWDILRRLEQLTGYRATVRQFHHGPATSATPLRTPPSCVLTSAGSRGVCLDEGLARQWEWQARNDEPVDLAAAIGAAS